jgi:hypothetical protein
MPQSVTIRHALNIVLPVNGRVGNVRRTLGGFQDPLPRSIHIPEAFVGISVGMDFAMDCVSLILR